MDAEPLQLARLIVTVLFVGGAIAYWLDGGATQTVVVSSGKDHRGRSFVRSGAFYLLLHADSQLVDKAERRLRNLFALSPGPAPAFWWKRQAFLGRLTRAGTSLRLSGENEALVLGFRYRLILPPRADLAVLPDGRLLVFALDVEPGWLTAFLLNPATLEGEPSTSAPLDDLDLTRTDGRIRPLFALDLTSPKATEAIPALRPADEVPTCLVVPFGASARDETLGLIILDLAAGQVRSYDLTSANHDGLKLDADAHCVAALDGESGVVIAGLDTSILRYDHSENHLVYWHGD